jgi:hypothetical protein
MTGPWAKRKCNKKHGVASVDARSIARDTTIIPLFLLGNGRFLEPPLFPPGACLSKSYQLAARYKDVVFCSFLFSFLLFLTRVFSRSFPFIPLSDIV